MFTDEDYRGLLKVSQAMTVGDVIVAMNADMAANPFTRRQVIDKINASGLNVHSPASRLASAIGGGMLGSFVAKYLGLGGLGRGLAAIGGSIIGGRAYDRAHPPAASIGYRLHTY